MVSEMLWCRQAKSRSPGRWGTSENPHINKKLSFPWTGKWSTMYYTNWCMFLSVFCCLGAAVNKNKTVYILSCLDVPLIARRNVETLHTAVLNWMSESETSVTPPITVKVWDLENTAKYLKGQSSAVIVGPVDFIDFVLFLTLYIKTETYLWIAGTLSAGILFWQLSETLMWMWSLWVWFSE